MIIETWNIRRFTPDKRTAVKGLFRSADILCLTETIDKFEPSPNSLSANAACPRTTKAPRQRGGVAVLSRSAIPLQLTYKTSRKFCQGVAGSVNGFPLVA